MKQAVHELKMYPKWTEVDPKWTRNETKWIQNVPVRTSGESTKPEVPSVTGVIILSV